MAHEPIDRLQLGDTLITRRTLLGAAIAAGVLGPVISAGTAQANSSSERAGEDATDSQPADEQYEIPDEIGSAPWW